MHSIYAYVGFRAAGPGAKPEFRAAAPETKGAREVFGEHLECALKTEDPGKSSAASRGPLFDLQPKAVYEEMGPLCPAGTISEQMRIYKEDQLLAHPGGDRMDLSAPDPIQVGPDNGSLWGRIQKDLSDAWENLKNLFRDLFFGSSYRYVNGKGEIQRAKRPGLTGRAVEFIKDVASGLSLGYVREAGEPAPKGLRERLGYAARKIFGEALKDDLLFGIPQAALNLVDDAALALWNLIETVPDATIGSLPQGAEFTTDLFDNGQVMIDFITDCLPAGEAWMRVHAYKLQENGVMPPVLFNLKLPVHFIEDETWSTVRNTGFRKSIETVGSILPDIGASFLTQYALRTSKRK